MRGLLWIYLLGLTHEIDTIARRRVPLAFPAEWEHRELTGRDYGIDMMIEIFSNGVATGRNLLLQIKGTTEDVSKKNRICYDVPVKTLKYSEMFLTPVLLVICPVNDIQCEFYYLWLQEYIKVVLDHDNPNWRLNRTTVRVQIPKRNFMPGDEDKLNFIAGFPKRIFEWCQFARICRELEYDLNNYFVSDDMSPEEFVDINAFNEVKNQAKEYLLRIINNINKIIQLESIFNEKNWVHPQYILKNTITPVLTIAKKLYNDSIEDKVEAKCALARIRCIFDLLGLYNDYDFSRALWEYDGEHIF